MPHKSPEARREYQRQYYQKNKERLDAAHKKWREENPEKVKEINAKASQKYRDDAKIKIIQPDLSESLRKIGLNDG